MNLSEIFGKEVITLPAETDPAKNKAKRDEAKRTETEKAETKKTNTGEGRQTFQIIYLPMKR